MKPEKSQVPQAHSALKDKVNLFYLLALLPLFLISYYDFWSLVIALYGFLFLLLKSQKLHTMKDIKTYQKLLGLLIIIGSFFIYYALILILPSPAFYGTANYIVFLFGLFMVFFDSSGLKEAVIPLFFIAAATSTSLVAAWLKPVFTPILDNTALLIVNILRAFGINAYIYPSSYAPTIGFTALAGNTVVASFVYECLGVFSALLFSIILIVVLFEDPSGWKTRLLASVIGILGTFAINILRVTIIFLTDYFYGAEAGANVHYVIGYAIFSAWLALFLYIYSKRHTIQIKTQSFFQRPKSPEA